MEMGKEGGDRDLGHDVLGVGKVGVAVDGARRRQNPVDHTPRPTSLFFFFHLLLSFVWPAS